LRTAAALGALTAAAPLHARAATFCVDPRGGACQATIQGAVSLAGPGDLVRVLPGTYFENVVVPAGKEGLRLVGASRTAVILDPDAPNAGTGIRVEASRVHIGNLTIRNGRQHGVAVAAGAQDVVLRDLRLVGGRGPAALRVEAGATGVRVTGNDVRAAGVVGIDLAGGNHGARITSNVVRQTEKGIVARGDDLEISANRVSHTHVYGIQVEGARARVAVNVLETAFNVPTAGILAAGADPTVRGNRLSLAGTLRVTCAPCTNGLVAQNTVTAAFREGGSFRGAGLHVGADAPGLLVRGNRVVAASDVAYLVEGTRVRLVQNTASDTGTPDGGDGFRIAGTGSHVLSDNVATRTGANGFLVAADGVTLERNHATEAGLNGFLVAGAAGSRSGVVLTRNRATHNAAAGFAVTGDAVGTVLVGNRGAGNRYDFCDDGSGTDVSGGNPFGTTSTVCDVTR
jgi:hypothetical protein